MVESGLKSVPQRRFTVANWKNLKDVSGFMRLFRVGLTSQGYDLSQVSDKDLERFVRNFLGSEDGEEGFCWLDLRPPAERDQPPKTAVVLGGGEASPDQLKRECREGRQEEREQAQEGPARIMDTIERLKAGSELAVPYPPPGEGYQLHSATVLQDLGDRLKIRLDTGKTCTIASTEALHWRGNRYYRYDGEVWKRGMALEDSWEWGYDGRFGPDDQKG
jgi:hypothetical protein